MSRTKHHGNKAKERTFKDGWRWLSQTPGWWNRMFHTHPQRRAAKLWERNVAKTATNDLDTLNTPPHGNKPHKYFW